MIRPINSNPPVTSGLSKLCSKNQPAAVKSEPQQQLQQQPADLFSPASFENRMNTWLTSTIQRMNANRTDVYNQAMADWKVNDRRCRELGLPSPPQPAAPQLETAEAKPTGWWMRNGSLA